MRSPIFHKLSANAASVFDLTSYDLLALPLKSAPSDLDDAGKGSIRDDDDMDESPIGMPIKIQDNDYPDNVIRLLRQGVKYVFVIYEENRSFDSYCATFPGAEGLFSYPASQTEDAPQVEA